MNCVNTHRPINRTFSVIEGRIQKQTDVQPPPTVPKPKLLDQVREAIRLRHYSPKTEDTVWLDEGRVVSDPTIITHYAREMIKVYQSYLSNVSSYDESTLIDMSREAWRRCASANRGATLRDEKFANVITRHLKADSNSWAVVVVGADHANEEPGYLVSRLKNAGVLCIVSDLRPE